MNSYLTVLKKYAVFSGRASRKEYWMFVLFNLLFSILFAILDNVAGIATQGTGPIYLIYSLVILIPSLAVSVRRLHDIGKSGWMILISLIPIIGSIWLIVLLATGSDAEENKYGPSSK